MHVLLCSSISKWETCQEPTSWYLSVVIISCILWCPIPSCAVISLIVTLHFTLMNISTFWLLHWVMATGWLINIVCVSPIFWHCWHPCRNLYVQWVTYRCLQLRCSTLQEIPSLYAVKMICHWQPFCHGGLWECQTCVHTEEARCCYKCFIPCSAVCHRCV
jgi:hypothetical protein